MKIHNIMDVRRWRLCCGCGACKSFCKNSAITLQNVLSEGIRPVVDSEKCEQCCECINICPGLVLKQSQPQKETVKELQQCWGQIFSLFEGYAVDDKIRYSCSSGGAASAIALFCLENYGYDQVMHVGMTREKPWQCSTVISADRNELLYNCGSRYSPASPCDSIDKLFKSDLRTVFIGKPCDIAALSMMQQKQPLLQNKEILKIGIFCAGTPSSQGSIEFLKKKGISENTISSIRYRGNGWPGHFSYTDCDNKHIQLADYKESWGFLQKYRPLRCHLCPDGTSEFADVSCGDPWYKPPENDECGRSLVLTRTQKGQDIIKRACEKNYLKLDKVDPSVLINSQLNLLGKRKSIWGRLFSFRILYIPKPKYSGFHLFNSWRTLPFISILKSVVGTLKRILTRKYYNPKQI